MKAKTILLFLSPFCLFYFLMVEPEKMFLFGGGQVTIKSTVGDKITIKKKNTTCKTARHSWVGQPEFLDNAYATDCTVNGVRTDLTGKRYPFTDSQRCLTDRYTWDGSYGWAVGLGKKPNGIKKNANLNEDSFACIAAKKFGLFATSRATIANPWGN